jgi:phage RecT family recombinase
MSQLPVVTEILSGSAKHFATQNSHGLKFESECLFAKQQIMANDLSVKTAQNRPDSLKSAILNVAAIGISLNPATAHAYLVPRDGQIRLNMSYRGLVKLATDSGAIEWAKAVLVYEGDQFTWRGPAEPPIHEADVFADGRIDAADPLKNLKGGYCLAKLATGEYMVDVMTAGEILEVKNSSKARNGPWSGKWAGEMAKKTLVKRASKSWPQSSGRDRLDTAIHVLNQHEGMEESAPIDEEKVSEFLNLVAAGQPMPVLEFMAGADDDLAAACYNSAPHGEKVKLKNRVKALIGEANDIISSYCTEIAELAERQDPAALDYYAELEGFELKAVDARLTDITHRQIAELQRGAA